MSAALQNLRNAIATNTLTALQQAALTQALDAIIPTFPEPDEISDSIPPTEEELAREWIAALYSLQSTGGGGPPMPPSKPIFSVANQAALAALDATTFPAGTLVYVLTFGRYFSYQPALAQTPVTGVFVNATPVGQWETALTGIAESAAQQTAWFVDDQDLFGGNDENTGLDAAHPVRTKAEIMRRWGTWSPEIQGVNVVVTYLSADTAGNDPGLFSPLLINGATLTHTAALPAAAFTATLLAVTPNNTGASPGNALESTFTTLTGAVAANMILVNATRGNSRALAVRNLGAGNWLLSQPLTPYTALTTPAPANVDTWAAGDSISGFVPIAVDIAIVGGKISTIFNSTFSPGHVVQNITVADLSANATGACDIDLAVWPFFVDCVLKRQANIRGPVVGPLCQGVAHTLGVQYLAMDGSPIAGGAPAQYQQAGGILRGAVGRCTNRPIIEGGSILRDCEQAGVGNELFIDNNAATTFLVVQGIVDVTDANWKFYGPGTVNVKGSLTTTGTGATLFGALSTMQLNGVATGYSAATSAGVTVIHGGIALSAANFDAGAGAAGFGALAFSVGAGASIVRNGAQP